MRVVLILARSFQVVSETMEIFENVSENFRDINFVPVFIAGFYLLLFGNPILNRLFRV